MDPHSIPSKVHSEKELDQSPKSSIIDPNSYGLNNKTPIFNYHGDGENAEDYFIVWVWNGLSGQADLGLDLESFLGKQQIHMDH